MLDGRYARHDLLQVTPEGWRATLTVTEGLERLSDEPRRLVEGWCERGWPVIVRRPGEGHETGIAVGLPLPPSHGKLRLGFTLAPHHVAHQVPGVALADALATAPADLRPQLEAVIALSKRLSLTPTVFGALLWQHVTGLVYLRPGSDVDLLWPMSDPGPLPGLLDGLAALDAEGPARLDGEIILPNGEGVNWRELRDQRGRLDDHVLVKSLDGAELRCARNLFS